jgi:hypothetical protein
MYRRLALALAVVGALLLATAGQASARDRNNDRLPDRWERHHGLSLKVKQTRRDQDRDGLRNLAEFRSHMDPRDDDSDDDGIEDGDENAGKISAFEDGTLSIALFGGGEVSGKVTADTEIECEDEQGDDDSGDDDDSDDRGVLHDGGDDDHEGDDDCGDAALTVGAVVEEAELEVGAAGAIWEEIELG